MKYDRDELLKIIEDNYYRLKGNYLTNEEVREFKLHYYHPYFRFSKHDRFYFTIDIFNKPMFDNKLLWNNELDWPNSYFEIDLLPTNILSKIVKEFNLLPGGLIWDEKCKKGECKNGP